MTFETDQRLKSYLDTNQLHREQMCLAVLAIDRRFSNVRPRHPRGGPDGGRDMEGWFQGQQRVFGAVGFLNQANDSNEHKQLAARKFRQDLDAALVAEPSLAVFVFFTNVNLTVHEKDELVALARAKGVGYTEIFDRERIRISLDGPDGFGIRLQYLQILMTPEEQTSFFARWGDDIQGVIAEGFGKLEKTLNRLHFLAETELPLRHLVVILELDREYLHTDIGHFRAFCGLQLKEPKASVFGVLFGTTDNPNRSNAISVADLDPSKAGIGRGMCGGRWEHRLDERAENEPTPEANDDNPHDGGNYVQVGSFTSIGKEKVRSLSMDFGYDAFIRMPPYLLLRDLDDANFALFLNRSLADKIKAIHVYGNEYKLAEFGRERMRVDSPIESFAVPMVFSEAELADPWGRVMQELSPFCQLSSKSDQGLSRKTDQGKVRFQSLG
jgi:hypothetical protein